MKIFDDLMARLAGKKKPAPTSATPTSATLAPAAAPKIEPAAPAPLADVDVEEILEDLAKANPQKLNWKTSIVDLLKLLDMESSLANRKALAAEMLFLGDMNNSAEMNVWLHKAVLRKLAENGGKVPSYLLD
ncbi:MAG: DUF3597 domain-containing protein [Caulobacterales bacterium]|jgi:hypothetical protein